MTYCIVENGLEFVILLPPFLGAEVQGCATTSSLGRVGDHPDCIRIGDLNINISRLINLISYCSLLLYRNKSHVNTTRYPVILLKLLFLVGTFFLRN